MAHVVGIPIEETLGMFAPAAALTAGSSNPPPRFDHREDAVAWVRATLGSGDAVLFLNDLPDHYP